MVRMPVDALEDLAGAVGGPVVDAEQLVGHPGGLEGRPDALDLQLDVVALVVAGQHDSDVGAHRDSPATARGLEMTAANAVASSSRERRRSWRERARPTRRASQDERPGGMGCSSKVASLGVRGCRRLLLTTVSTLPHGTRPVGERRFASGRSSREGSVNPVPKPGKVAGPDGDGAGSARRLRRCTAIPIPASGAPSAGPGRRGPRLPRPRRRAGGGRPPVPAARRAVPRRLRGDGAGRPAAHPLRRRCRRAGCR